MADVAMRPRPVRRTVAVVLKSVLGLAVFVLVVGGWTAVQAYRRAHEPLPDAGGRQGPCVLWFVGSSSIHRWTTLAGDMHPWITHNRGVGGALLPELTQRFASEDVPQPPEAIIFYGGDNDIAKGQSAAETARQFRLFVAAKMAKLPAVPMLVIGVKPSPKRWSMRPVQLAFDEAVRDAARQTPNLRFVDASAGMLVNGRPGPFFEQDGIHLSAAGYRIWSRYVRNQVGRSLPRATVNRCTGGAGRAAGA